MTKHWPSDRVAMAAKAKQEPCLWTEDAPDGGWIGSCGIRWECDYETPIPNDENSALISEQAVAEILMATGFWDNDVEGK